MSDTIPVVIIGTAARSAYMYGPILQGLKSHVRLTGVWGRSESSASALGDRLGVRWYTDMDALVRETRPLLGVVCVGRPANGSVARLALDHGLHVLVETPISEDPKQADELIQTARQRSLKIEVAEQFHRRPLEQIKLKLIETGIFGKVYSSFNDFAGHGYHGVSVLRSYLGFNVRPIRVMGAIRDYPLATHHAFVSNTFGPRNETQEHGLIQFEGGLLGIYHWTSVGYDSALRWWRSSRFLAEKGMGISIGVGNETQERLSLISAGGEAPQFITIQRIFERCDGGALRAIKAHTGNANRPIVTWENPFARARSGENVQWHDDEIGVAGCLMSLVDAVRYNKDPTYGPAQGRIDQEIVLAMQMSSRHNGTPVDLPLGA